MRENKISRHYVWIEHSRIFKLCITYPLEAYFLDSKICQFFNSIFAKTSISAMGMNRDFPTKLRNGNCNYGVLNILNIGI